MLMNRSVSLNASCLFFLLAVAPACFAVSEKIDSLIEYFHTARGLLFLCLLDLRERESEPVGRTAAAIEELVHQYAAL